MKIITPGSPEEEKKKCWWLGLTITCDSCKLVAELTFEDRKLINSGWHYTQHGRSGYGVVDAKCPNCGFNMHTTVSKDEFHKRIKEAEGRI